MHKRSMSQILSVHISIGYFPMIIQEYS